eukprot:m.1658987 g.1658987  ORF g.1658987 m.1658987 type:complete len:51 (+) comp117759_c0_seq1:95-247(+)
MLVVVYTVVYIAGVVDLSMDCQQCSWIDCMYLFLCKFVPLVTEGSSKFST